MGDVPALADSILELGLLQPIGVTPDKKLIFGSRRIAAHRHIGRSMIEYREVAIDTIASGACAENEIRKDFTLAERVAIYKTLNRDKVGGDRKSKNHCQDIGNDPKKPLGRDDASRKAGLGNHTSAQEAERVFTTGIPSLQAAVDNKEISINNGYLIARQPTGEQVRIMALPGAERVVALTRLREAVRASSKAKKTRDAAKAGAKKTSRNVIHMPTYNPNRNPLTDEERGIPPRETWDEPDPDRPGLNRIQGYTAKHGHVHIMPLARRQAQDRRAAAADLGTRLRDLDKAVQAFLGGDKPLVTAADLADVLTMPSKDTGMIIPRITERMAVLRASCDTLADYLDTVDAVLNREGREETA
jgi:hypothetical protein